MNPTATDPNAALTESNHPANGLEPGKSQCWHTIGVLGKATCPELKTVAHCHNCPVYSQAAAQLLDQPLSDAYQRDYSSSFSSQKTAAHLATESIVIFRIGIEWLGLPTRVFQEVAEQHIVHTIPHRSDGNIKGLVNIRGRLLVCIALNELLGIDANLETRTERRITYKRLLVVEKDGHRLAYPVHEVHGVHHFNPNDLKEPPASVTQTASAYVRTLLPWQEKNVGCLDDELLFYTLSKNLG
jgi:chemotaxis-related protein WspD